MKPLFFDTWQSIVRTLVIKVLTYVILIVMLRISGKRTMTKMNAFDFIVTVALGSTMASVALNKNVAPADGVLAFFLLISFQYVIIYLLVRSKRINALVKATPTQLTYKGKILWKAMITERITEDEIFAIIREKGFSSLQDVAGIVIETDGSLTVIKSLKERNNDALDKLTRSQHLNK